MLFLGTGAAELVPNPFCRCQLCQRIRAGKEMPRRRSALLYDKEICIDFGPDILAASQQYDAPLYDLTDIFITHTHEDHLSTDNLSVLWIKESPVRLWLSEKGVQWLEQYRELCRPLYRGKCQLDDLIEKGKLSIHTFQPYQWHTIGNARVFAISTNHQGWHPEELSLNYVIEKNGQRLLYAADTGLYSEENLTALQNFGCDTVVMEGTYGSLDMDRGIGHLTCDSFIENAENLVARGAAKPDAKFYVTHINQCHSLNHQEYQNYMSDHCKLDITVAYDGMKV